ncbi:unnamed protein product, partial [Mesorhabditis belari]|uniref:Uncharacterized protein n=1 Tax=Mesorhabditis belari TaxID=2138241 RepID=A0AAF3E9U5_9BILA
MIAFYWGFGMVWFVGFLSSNLPSTSHAQSCFSCTGICHSEPCNCQMGLCSSEMCFIERKPTEIKGSFRITKGCIENPARTQEICDFDHFPDHLQCVCRGHNCNDHIYLLHQSFQYRKNITCRKCSERDPDCGDTCYGHWCHEDSATGASGCGYGPPSLPFFHKGPELFYHTSKICVTMSRGSGVPRRHCICNRPYCNHAKQAYRNAQPPSPHDLPFRQCYNCDVNAQEAAITASCKQNRCIGHYCTFARHQQLLPNGQQITSEKQGCMNVSMSSQIQLGCAKKWLRGEFVEESCACNNYDLCNRDVYTAATSQRNPFRLFILFCLIRNFF